MTLMTTFLEEGGKGETQKRRGFSLLPTGPTGPAMESQGTGTQGDRREKREKTRAQKPGHFCRLRLPAC